MSLNSKFALKIALLPTVAGISFVIVIAISWVTGSRGISVLEDIETGYYSSLELNRQLYEELDAIQRAFQDATAMSDQEYIDDAEQGQVNFLELVRMGQKNTVVDVAPLVQLESEFTEYFKLARSSSENLIDGSGGLEGYENLQSVSEMHANLLGAIKAVTARDEQDVSTAFKSAQERQRSGTLFLIAVAMVALVLLTAVSIIIIRISSQSIRTTVKGMNALAAGDLSQVSRSSAKDEMGHMVDRVNHVTQTVNALANEIQLLIDSVRKGKLQVRGEPSRFQGDYALLIGNINELIDAFVAPIAVTAGYVERIARGDMPPPIEDTYQGDFNHTKQNLNALVSTMNGLIHQVDGMTSAAKAGNLEERGNPAEFSGVWRELVIGINDTLDAVTGPLQEFSLVMSAMAHGDLAISSKGAYQGEFAKLQSDTNTSIAKLTEVISSIQESGDSVSLVAHEISEGNQSLRSRTEDQASSLQAAQQTMDSMTSMVKNNAQSAYQASQKVMETSDKAKKGGTVVGKAVHAMQGINASSEKIADIINVIDELAFQTNLLALNAAVEAARAGEEGRGFAVVANEVRNLAGRSADAAKQINALISDSVAKVEEGSRLVDESGQMLDEIVTAVLDVTNIVTEISESSQEQTVSIDDVNGAITSMEAMTKKNAELAVAAVRASNMMGQEAARLNQMTAFFNIHPESDSVSADQDDHSSNGNAAVIVPTPGATVSSNGAAVLQESDRLERTS